MKTFFLKIFFATVLLLNGAFAYSDGIPLVDGPERVWNINEYLDRFFRNRSPNEKVEFSYGNFRYTAIYLGVDNNGTFLVYDVSAVPIPSAGEVDSKQDSQGGRANQNSDSVDLDKHSVSEKNGAPVDGPSSWSLTDVQKAGLTGAGKKVIGLLAVPPEKVKEFLSAKAYAEYQAVMLKELQEEFKNQIVNGTVKLAVAVAAGLSELEKGPNLNLDIKVDLNSYQKFSSPENVEFKSDDSSFLAQANEYYTKIYNHVPLTRLEVFARQIGLNSLIVADEANSDGFLEISNSQMEIATAMGDILFGLDPYTGFARDCLEFFSGNNIVTGEKLTPLERSISGIFVGASLVTAGAASSLKNAIVATFKVSERLNKLRKSSQFLKNSAGALASLPYMDVITRLGFEKRNNRKKLDAFAKTTKHWDALAWNTYPKVSADLRLSERKLSQEASRLGISAEELAIKRETAIGFMNSNKKFTGNADQIKSGLEGIDFSGPVEVTKIPKGTIVESWQIPENKMGQYVTTERTSPGSLGIDSIGMGKDELLYAKVPKQYVATEDVPALKSKAEGIIDDWSWERDFKRNIPDPIFENRSVKTRGNYQPGGADQFLIQKDVFKEIN